MIREIEVTGLAVRQAPPPNPAVASACEAFLAEAKVRGLRQPTLYKYQLLFRRLMEFAEARGLKGIGGFSLEILREFRGSWPHRGMSANKRLEELCAFFRFCSESGWIDGNPARKLRPQRVEDPPRLPFSEAEIHRVRAAIDQYSKHGRADTQRLRTLFELLLQSGLRIGDGVRLRRDSISDGELTIRTEKTGTSVTLPLSDWLMGQLALVSGTSKDYFFWSGQGKVKSSIGDWQRSLKKLFRLARVPDGCAHRLRHTFAKRFLNSGVAPERLSVLMGHRNPAITMKYYAQWVRERQEQLDADVRRVQESYAR